MSLEVQQWLDTTPDATLTPEDRDYLEPSVVGNIVRSTPEAVAILDLRKNDFVGGKIKGAFNIPAQSTTHSIEDIYNLFDNAGKKQIIVHCASSKNRATRVWGWLTDYANTKPGSERLNISILKGGYNAFKEEPENSDLIDN